jgi:hypothetical protein
MMFPAGARSRLLPMSLPFRYFGAAVVFQLAAWALVFAFPAELISFESGLGPVFAALHLVTLGVLAMTAIGATLQLLPVATRQPVRSPGAAKLVWWLLVPGVAVFAYGAAAFAPQTMGVGAMLVVVALAIYALLLGANLYGARGMKLVVAHGWAALACLAALAASGLALAARYEHGLALDYGAWRTTHLVLATYGFMGLLAIGLSTFLLPMLAVAPAPSARSAYAVLALAVAAIVAAVIGWELAAALLGLIAAVAHTVTLERALRARLRPALGPGFPLVRVSWICLVASVAMALFIALEMAPPRALLLFGLLLVPGWLLTFLLGVLQRIVPFLASVHASTTARGTPLISALTPGPLLALHQALHVAALAALLVAALLGAPWLARAGAAAGLAGAVVFAVFFAFVLMKVRQHGIPPPHQPATA